MPAELRSSQRLQRALERVRTLEAAYVVGESRLPLEAAKVALADVVLALLAKWELRTDRLAQVPAAPPARILELRRRRRKKA
jgi:hypothetical protein